MKGGVGTWVVQSGAVSVGAVVVVNAFGDIRDASGQIIAGARGEGGAFLDATKVLTTGGPQRDQSPMQNTTISVIATNARCTRVQLQQLAAATSAAYYRRITPAGTSYDGDTIFSLGPETGPEASFLMVEALAVQAMEMAIERAVRLAAGRDSVPGLADRSR
jgi:L-aminopeptidase/D-esterase-like protein